MERRSITPSYSQFNAGLQDALRGSACKGDSDTSTTYLCGYEAGMEQRKRAVRRAGAVVCIPDQEQAFAAGVFGAVVLLAALRFWMPFELGSALQ